MTNFEWLLENEKDLVKRIILGGKLAKQNGKPKLCPSITCEDCDWEEDCGLYQPSPISKWLDEEHKEPSPYDDWEIDDKIEVRNSETAPWRQRHFAGVDDISGNPIAWADGSTSWTCNNNKTRISVWKYARKVEE